MARLYMCGAEAAATSGANTQIEGVSSGTTAPTRDTSVFRSGAASWKLDSGSPFSTTQISVVPPSVTGAPAASTTYYARLYVRWSSFGPSNVRFMEFGNSGGIEVRTTSGGALQLWRSGTTQIGSDSAALSTGTWYRVELSVTANAGATQWAAAELMLDGVSVASGSGLTVATSGVNLRFGIPTNPGATNTIINFDDLAINDSTGANQNSWPGSGKIVMLLPVSDNARGTGWVNDANAASGFFSATDNEPPDGIADTTASTGLHQIRNGTSNANSSVDLDLTDYTTAGVGASDTINVLLPVVATGAPVTTGAKQGTVGIVSNPAIANISLNATGTSGAFWQGNTAGTWPTGWKMNNGTITHAPSVTLGTKPVFRITQVTSSTRIAMVCFCGMYVDYTPVATARVPRSPGVDSGNAHL